MIEINNLVKRYGDKKAVNGISFTVNDDEVLGFDEYHHRISFFHFGNR